MAADHTIVRSALRQAGIIEVLDLNELMDHLRGFSKIKGFTAIDKAGTAVVTFSGGGGIVTSDMLYESGLSLADLSRDTIAALKSVYPPWMEPANPADIWPAIEYSGIGKVYTTVSKAVMNDPGVDSVILHIFTSMIDSTIFKDLARLKDDLGKPVVAWLTGIGDQLKACRSILEDLGIPVFDEMGRAVSVLAALKRHFQKSK
jgi:acetyltransferase